MGTRYGTPLELYTERRFPVGHGDVSLLAVHSTTQAHSAQLCSWLESFEANSNWRMDVD